MPSAGENPTISAAEDLIIFHCRLVCAGKHFCGNESRLILVAWIVGFAIVLRASVVLALEFS